jgi:hypothetical protein
MIGESRWETAVKRRGQVRQTCRSAVAIGVSDQVASPSALQVVMVV